MAESHSAAFEKAIEVTPVGSHTYSAHLDAKWCIGVVPHGGYLGSILYRTTTTHFKATQSSRFRSPPEPISFQLSYLRRTAIGPAIIQVQDVKIGTRVSTIHVTVLQAPDSAVPDKLEVKVVAYINASPPETESGPSYEGVWGLEPKPAAGSGSGSGSGSNSGSGVPGNVDLAALVRNQKDGDWTRLQLPHPGMFALRNTELYGPRPAAATPTTTQSQAEQVVDQWARFTPYGKAARWSNEAVVFLLDVFPAALERLGALEALRMKDEKASSGSDAQPGTFWYPTVSLNLDLKSRIPPEGVEWLYSRVETKMLRNSRADLEVTVLDDNGRLVATSSQIALVVDASRNTKPRKNGSL